MSVPRRREKRATDEKKNIQGRQRSPADGRDSSSHFRTGRSSILPSYDVAPVPSAYSLGESEIQQRRDSSNSQVLPLSSENLAIPIGFVNFNSVFIAAAFLNLGLALWSMGFELLVIEMVFVDPLLLFSAFAYFTLEPRWMSMMIILLLALILLCNNGIVLLIMHFQGSFHLSWESWHKFWVTVWNSEWLLLTIIYFCVVVGVYFIFSRNRNPTSSSRKFRSTLKRVREQAMIRLSECSNLENCIGILCGSFYILFMSLTASLSDRIFHFLVVVYIIFNNEGRYNTLSSSFKPGSSKVTFVFLVFLHDFYRIFLHGLKVDDLKVNEISVTLRCYEFALKVLIFLFHTDNKLGNATHMSFVIGLLLFKLYHRPDLISNFYLFPCALCFYFGDILCKDRQNEIATEIQHLKSTNETKIAMCISEALPDLSVGKVLSILHAYSVGEDRDLEFETIYGVRYYYNLSHYTAHLHFSPAVLLCELVLFTV